AARVGPEGASGLLEPPRRPLAAGRSAPAGERAAARSAPRPGAPAPWAPAPSPAAEKGAKRPKAFAEDWNATGTPHPPTTIANTEIAAAALDGGWKPRPIGDRLRRTPGGALARVPPAAHLSGR